MIDREGENERENERMGYIERERERKVSKLYLDALIKCYNETKIIELIRSLKKTAQTRTD